MINLLRVFTIISLYQIASKVKLGVAIFILAKIYEILLIPFRGKKHKGNNLSQALVKCLYDLGPVYVKFGQTLSTRPDIVGEEIADALRELQDRLPAFEFSKVKLIIESSLNLKIEEAFAQFEIIPVAAASISQVHKAALHNGDNVAVKILRPDIHKLYLRDIKLLEFLAKISKYILKDVERLRPFEIVKFFHSTMQQELNFMLEAAAASELKDNSKDNPDLLIPKVYWDHTSTDVLTTEWLEGISIYDKVKIAKANLNLEEIASKIAIMFFNQAYRYGFFHADLHPGNVLVMPDGRIGLIDFGIMGRLPERDRLAVAEILYGFLKKDYMQVAKVHLEAGYVPKNTNIYLFAQSCRAIGEPIVGMPASGISVAKLLTQLFKTTKAFGMETQPQLLMLQKTTVVVEGIGRMLNPEVNLWKLAEPWIKKWAAKNISPEAKILRAFKKIVSELIKK